MPHPASYVTATLLATLVLLGVYFGLQAAWSEVFVVVVALLLSVVPYALERHFAIRVNPLLKTGIAFFTAGTLILGGMFNFYNLFPWWDIFLHVLAGFGLALLGYSLLFSLIRQESLQARPLFHTTFVFAGACTVLLLWEVYEFTIDQLNWSSNLMQLSLYDTMIDLVVGLASVTIVCISGYLVLTHQKNALAARLTPDDTVS
jgi:hypothetical protein